MTIMEFKIDEVSGSAVSKFSFGIMACSIVSYNISLASHNGATTTGAWVLMSVAGIVLLAWIIWFFYMYISGNKVIAMPRRTSIVSTVINSIIFILWILSDFVKAACHPIMGICVWCLLAVSVIYYVVYCLKHGSFN